MISKANQRFSSGLALTFGARLLMATNSVVAGVLVARLLGAESLGIYLVLMTAVQMLIQVANFGLPVANTFFTAREAENLRPAAINSVLLCLLTGSIGALLVWAFSDVVLVGVPAQLAILGLLCVPFQLVTSVLFNLFLARDEVKTFNFLDLLNQSFILINAVVVLLILSSGLWILVGFNTAASVGMSVLTAVMFYSYVSGKRFSGKWRLDLGLLGRTIRFSTKGHILWISQIFVQRLDLIIVNYFRGATEASVYAVATQCTLFLLMLPLAVSQLLQVRVSSDRDEGGEFTCRVARQTSMILFAACLASVPAAFVVARIYGQGFEDLPYQLWLLLPGVFCVGVQQVIAQHFIGRGMPVFLPISWLATVAVNIAANVFVVPIYGARGAAIVATLSYFGIAGVVISSFVRKTRFGLGNVLIPNRQDIKETINIVRGLLPFRRTE